MTVIKDKQTFKYPSPNSATVSDTESLHLGSISASDVEDEPVTNRIRPKLIKVSQVEELINIKKNPGRKKLRRYQNRCILQTLNEDEENLVIMENYKGPFARLLDNKEAFDYWQEFIEKSDDEQIEIIRNIGKYPNRGKISSWIKRTFKIRKNLDLDIVQIFEDDLIDFFKAGPGDRYVKVFSKSFDRLLIHAIAQYHGLKSISIILDDSHKSVEVYNTDKNWMPANYYLTDFIRHLRK